MTIQDLQAYVKFTEAYLNIKYNGSLTDKAHMSLFLNEYLQEAYYIYDELRCEYAAYAMELLD